MTLTNAFSELAAEQTVQALRLAVAALTRTIGLMTPNAAGQMRVSLDTAPAALNVSAVNTVSTVSNQNQVGGYNANDQIPALMRFSAASLRTNIQIT